MDRGQHESAAQHGNLGCNEFPLGNERQLAAHAPDADCAGWRKPHCVGGIRKHRNRSLRELPVR